MSKEFSFIKTPKTTLVSLNYYLGRFEQYGRDKDTKSFYQALQLAVDNLASADKKDKAFWDAQIAMLEAKANEYVSMLNQDNSGEKHELVSSVLGIAKAYHNINPKTAVGPVKSFDRERVIGYLDDLEEAFSENAEGASPEYLKILEDIRYLRDITEGFEKQGEIDGACHMLFENCVAYISDAADKKLSNDEKLRLDNVVRTAMVSHHAKHIENLPAQKTVDEFILSAKLAKIRISEYEKSDIISLNNTAALRKSSLTELFDEMSSQKTDKFWNMFISSLSEEQLAGYAKLSPADVKVLYDDIQPKHYEPAAGYIAKIKTQANRYTRTADRKLYLNDALIEYASSTKLDLHVTRSAISSLAVCMLLQDGCSIEDVLSPDKLIDRKKEYGNRAAQLIKENKALEIAGSFMAGEEKLCDYLDKIQLEEFPITPEFFLTEKAINYSMCATLCNDISQEMGMAAFKEAVKNEIEKIKVEDPGRAGQLTEKYKLMVDRGAYSAVIPMGISPVFRNLCKFVSAPKHDLSLWADMVVTGFSFPKKINELVSDVKAEMQKTGKSYLQVMKDLEFGESQNKYSQAIVGHTSVLEKNRDLYENIQDKLVKDTTLPEKMIKAFFEGKYENVTVTGSYKPQITGFNSLLNELIDEKYKEAEVKEKPITITQYAHADRKGLVSAKSFTDTEDSFPFLTQDRLETIPSKEAYINGRKELLDKFIEDDYREDVDYPQEELDDYLRSHFDLYVSLSLNQIEEKKQISEAIRNELHRTVGERKLNLSIASFGLKKEDKQKLSGPFEVLFTSDVSDDGIKRNEEIANVLLNGSNDVKAKLIQDKLTELSKIDLTEVYEEHPESMKGRIGDIYALYSASDKIQSLIEEGAKLGIDFTSAENSEMLYNLQIRTNFALNLKHKIDFVCSPAYTMVNEKSLGIYLNDGKYLDDKGNVVQLSDFAKSKHYQEVPAFTKGLEGLANSAKNTDAQLICHVPDVGARSKYYIYKTNEAGSLVKGRMIDDQFVPAQFEMDGVILDTLYKDDLREELLSNIKKIREIIPDFDMTEAEIEEQLSDENINKTYRVRAKEKRLSQNKAKPKARNLTDKFYQRVNLTYLGEHGVDKSGLFGSNTLEGDQARRELVADIYNRMINLDAGVFDFNNEFGNKENEGKVPNIEGNPEMKNTVTKDRYDKAFDYALEHYEDLEYGMIVENSFDLNSSGFDISEKLRPELTLLRDKGSVLGGIARSIRDNHGNMNTLVLPVNKLTAGQVSQIIDGFYAKHHDEPDIAQFLMKMSAARNYLTQGLNSRDYIKEPTKHQYTADDLVTRRKTLPEIKESLGAIYESLVFANDGSEFFKTEQYTDFIAKQEKLLYSLSEIDGEISPELQERLCTEVKDLRAVSYPFETAVKNASVEIKDVMSPIMARYFDELFHFTLMEPPMSVSIDSWNKNDRKMPDAIARMKIGQFSSLNKNGEMVKLESVYAKDRLLGWEKLTGEKDFSLIANEEQALAAIKHFANGLDTTKRDHDEYKNFMAVLTNSISSIEKAAPADKWVALQNALESIGTTASCYINAKSENMKSFGLSERGERRFEKAQDLCRLAGALKGKVFKADHVQSSGYKKSAEKLLNEYSMVMELVSVSGDSREFKRLKDKLTYVRDMVVAADSRESIERHLQGLADEALDYYIKKIDAPLHGTRGKKLDLARAIYTLSQRSLMNPIPNPPKNMDADDYRFEIAIKIAKEQCRKNLNSPDISKKNEAKRCLSNPKAMLAAAGSIQVSASFERAFGRASKDQLKKLNEKSGADLSKMYAVKIPKPAKNRPVDAYINKFIKLSKDIDNATTQKQYISSKTGDLFQSNSLKYSTGRSMIRTFAICELLNKGYSFSDILDPDKLQTEKHFYANKGLRLVSNAHEKGDAAALEITNVLKNGGQKLIDIFNDLYSKMPDFSDANLLTETGKEMISAGLIAKDISQEIVRGIDQNDTSDPLVQEVNTMNDKLDTLNKPANDCHMYIQCFEKYCSTSSLQSHGKAVNLLPRLLAHKHVNKLIRDMKHDPANTGKTMLEMLNPDLDVYSVNNKVTEIGSIEIAIDDVLTERMDELAKDIFNDPFICDRYIEANSKGLFEQVEIKYIPQRNDVEIRNIDKLMNEIKNGGKQIEKPKKIDPELVKDGPQQQIQSDNKEIDSKVIQ